HYSKYICIEAIESSNEELWNLWHTIYSKQIENYFNIDEILTLVFRSLEENEKWKIFWNHFNIMYIDEELKEKIYCMIHIFNALNGEEFIGTYQKSSILKVLYHCCEIIIRYRKKLISKFLNLVFDICKTEVKEIIERCMELSIQDGEYDIVCILITYAKKIIPKPTHLPDEPNEKQCSCINILKLNGFL
ncbi:MAG: hypothetical protein QW303_02410, partial [Nitrososphaerota archaeon]